MNISNLNRRGWRGRFDGKRIAFPVLPGRPALSKLVGSSLELKERLLVQEPLETGRFDCDNPGLVNFKERFCGGRSLLSHLSTRSPRRHVSVALHIECRGNRLTRKVCWGANLNVTSTNRQASQ